MSSLNQGMSQRLREARLAAHLTQADVAKDLQISRQAVSAWEAGKTAPSLNQMCALCVLYGVSSDLILFGMKTVPASSKPVIQDMFRLRVPED